MESQINQMVSCRVQLPKIVINGIAWHDEGTVMAGCARKYAECPGLGEKKRNVPDILYVGIFNDMMIIIILKFIMKGVEIDSKTQQEEEG